MHYRIGKIDLARMLNEGLIIEEEHEVERQNHKLEDENEAFDTRNSLQNERKQASHRIRLQMGKILKVRETIINHK